MKRPEPAPEPPPKPSGRMPALLRGMKDILPSDQPYWKAVAQAVETIATQGRYERIDTPVLEEAWLFNRTIGKDTDIVEKEMYQFADWSGDMVALRPEGTAGIARAYIEHGLLNQPQPVRLYYSGPFFRYDRPQAGRYRQLHQFGFEIIGDAHPILDAQLIAMSARIYAVLGVPVTIEVNSIGDAACRPAYVKSLVDYYRARKNALCESCLKRLQKNPLRLLDCKEPDCRELSVDAPQTVDHLCEACRTHFVSVLEYLDELEVPYTLNPKVVRGLDYYTRTTFEIYAAGEEAASAQSALGGGGRYDSLIEQLSGRPVPAVGFACGVERLVSKLREKGGELPRLPRPDIFLCQLGDPARKVCLKLLEALRAQGVLVAESLSKDGIKPQLESADRSAASYALIIGQKEIMDGTILIRDMENGIQEVVDFQKAVPEIMKRLQRSKTNGQMMAPSSTPDTGTIMPSEDCLFCGIVAGRVPSTKLAEDGSSLAFVDIHPKAAIHFLVIPKIHIDSLVEAPADSAQLLGHLLQVVQQVAKQQGIDRAGYKVIINVGRNGGQVVPHLHLHCLGGESVIGTT